MEIITRVEVVAKQKGWTMSQVTLAWMQKRVTSPIIGFSSVERIDDALSARGKELSAGEAPVRIEVLEDGRPDGGKRLQTAHAPEAQHRPLASSERLNTIH